MKLTEKKNVKTITYSVESDTFKGFYIDIVEKTDIFDVWLYHNGIGIKDYVFGLPKKHTDSIESCIDIIQGNLYSEIRLYFDNYMSN